MTPFAERIAALEAAGYANATAMARLAHDVVLKALEVCGLRDNVTIKGGVVMSNMTGDLRRATMDMDIDFMHYGLTDENIDEWIRRLNCLEGVSISRSGEINARTYMRRLTARRTNWLQVDPRQATARRYPCRGRGSWGVPRSWRRRTVTPRRRCETGWRRTAGRFGSAMCLALIRRS